MNKEALVEDYKDTLNDDYDDGQALESFKAPLPDFSNIKHRTESDKLTKDEKKLLIHFQDLNKLVSSFFTLHDWFLSALSVFFSAQDKEGRPESGSQASRREEEKGRGRKDKT